MPTDRKPDNSTSFDIDIVRINGKRMTTTLFKQLYSQNPYNDDYESLYELKAKVLYQGKEFVLFITPNGIRKFDIAGFKTKVKITSLAENIYSCLCNTPSLALDNVKREINSYFSNKRDEESEDNYIIATLDRIRDAPQNRYSKREDDQNTLINYIDSEFKEYLEKEYKKGLLRIESRNKLTDILIGTPQAFIGT